MIDNEDPMRIVQRMQSQLQNLQQQLRQFDLENARLRAQIMKEQAMRKALEGNKDG